MTVGAVRQCCTAPASGRRPSRARITIAVIVVAAATLLGTRSVAAQTTEAVEYYGLDALGSVRVVFDAGGNVPRRPPAHPAVFLRAPATPSPEM
jgi:hypothetical protein